MRFAVHLMLLSVAVVALVAADSFEIHEYPDGRTVAPIESEHISMVAETVLIVPTGELEMWVPLMRVTCEFVFENRSDQSQTVSMGFPFDTKFGDAYTVLGEEEIIRELPEWPEGEDASDRVPEVLDFTAVADGDTLEVTYRKIERRTGEELLWFPVVATWEVEFGPGETLEVVNSYTTGWDYHGALGESTYLLRYILTSGAGWVGPIGRGLVSIVVPPDLADEQYSDSLICYWDATTGVRWNGDTLVWSFTDLEPTSDIEVAVHDRMWSSELEYLCYGDTWTALLGVEWNEEQLYAEVLGGFSESIYMPVPPQQLLMYCCNSLYRDLDLDEPYPWSNWHLAPSGTDVVDPSELPEPHSGRVEMLQSWVPRFEELRAVAGQAGYLEYLALFSDRWKWTANDILRYQQHPDRELDYLRLLSRLEDAVNGEMIEDEAIHAFYMLTGWYTGRGPNGLSDGISTVPEELVNERLEQLQSGS